MLIGIRCKCGRRLRVSDDQIGKAGSCPACHSRLHMVTSGYTPGQDQFHYLLAIMAGPYHVGEVILLAGQGPFEIGKLATKHIPLAGQSVSRNHCRIIRQGHQWRIEDEQSTNGVCVNGQQVDASEIKNGDVLQIGEYVMQFAIFPEARLPTPQPQTRTVDRKADDSPTEKATATATLDKVSAEPARFAPASEMPKPEIAEIEDVFLDDLSGLDYSDHTSTPSLYDDYALHRLSDGDILDVSGSEPTVILPASVRAGGPQCPSCSRRFPIKATLCPTCGIDLNTGRAILTPQEGSLDRMYLKSEGHVRWLSLLIWLGIYPISSDTYGERKPYVTRLILALTILLSLWFWNNEWTNAPQMGVLKNLVLWVGTAQPTAKDLAHFYGRTTYGDNAAFDAKCKDLEIRLTSRKIAIEKRIESFKDKSEPVPQSFSAELERIERLLNNIEIDAHKAIPAELQYQGRYNRLQLITHSFLPASVLHLLVNILFLLTIGPRLNILVGNLAMLFLYLFLAAMDGLIFMVCRHNSIPQPYVDASGAIMGLCGMYLILMPMHLVHLAAWWRRVFWGGFKLKLKLCSVRGYWIVLAYIIFDVLATVFVSENPVAFWTHIAVFLLGVTIALFLLFARLVNCRGGDLFTGLLGMNAWSLIGKPNLTRKAPLEYGW